MKTVGKEVIEHEEEHGNPWPEYQDSYSCYYRHPVFYRSNKRYAGHYLDHYSNNLSTDEHYRLVSGLYAFRLFDKEVRWAAEEPVSKGKQVSKGTFFLLQRFFVKFCFFGGGQAVALDLIVRVVEIKGKFYKKGIICPTICVRCNQIRWPVQWKNSLGILCYETVKAGIFI